MVAKLYEILYLNFLKPLLFKLDPHLVHQSFLNYGHSLGESAIGKMIAKTSFYYENPKLKQEICGLTFNNPVGLSAGFDKDGDLINILPHVGFGFMQVGSVTLDSYEGNETPWVYRLEKSKSILVNYGLKNIGVKKIAEKIKKRKTPENFQVSVSVAKTNSQKTASDENGIKDYYQCLKYLVEQDVGDFYTINISCPNVFGGEPFTKEGKLDQLLSKLAEIKHNKPVFLKMPINSPWDEFKKLCQVAIKHQINGVVVGNLNKDRNDPAIKDEIPQELNGNLSGLPTQKLSNELISQTYREFGNKMVIVGVGGIFSAEDAYEKIKRGASLVQLVTGMIYQGPQLVGQINRDLVKMLEKDGYNNISQAIGAKYK